MSTATVNEQSAQEVNIFGKGCLFDLTIGTWSGRKMLSNGDMKRMGLDPEVLPREAVNYGRKLLVPKDELQKITKIELRARNLLRKYSVPFGIAQVHFVPVNILPTIQAELMEYKAEFFEKVDSFIKRFDAMRQAVQDAHPEFYDKCLKAHYPGSAQRLREKFHFDWHSFRIAPFDIEETDAVELLAEDDARRAMFEEKKAEMRKVAGNFMEDYIGTLRQGVVEFCELMTARVQGNPHGDEEKAKKLTARSLGGFRKSIQRFKDMNIWGDNEIEKMLDDFRKEYLDEGIEAKDITNNMSDNVSKALSAIREKAEENIESKFGGLKRKVVI